MGDEKGLFERLEAYAASDMLPMHMPGHKRNPLSPCLKKLGAELDLTEIYGFDNLHEPSGILKEAQDRAAALWGADESYFLVNGSTGGILASLYAAAQPGGQVLLSRGSHKSVFHAVELLGLIPRFVVPPLLPDLGCFGPLSPEAVENALQRYPEAKALVVTSPTYEGVISDIRGISEICRRHGTLLIVDEAHGAHLGMGSFPAGAVSQGADLTIQSLHKTLPSLTQTAILHRNRDRVNPARLRHALSVFQTSSPSYLLMASIDSCVDLLARRPEIFTRWHELLEEFYRKTSNLTHISFPLWEAFRKQPQRFDIGKIVLSMPGVSGFALADALRQEYHIELEMAAPRYALAMTGPGDTQESFSRLAEALRALDASPPEKTTALPPALPYEVIPELAVPPGTAMSLSRRFVPAVSSGGMVSAEYVWAYPPGIPLVIPGEVITGELAEALADPGSRLHSTYGKLPDEAAVIEKQACPT